MSFWNQNEKNPEKKYSWSCGLVSGKAHGGNRSEILPWDLIQTSVIILKVKNPFCQHNLLKGKKTAWQSCLVTE